MSMAAGPIAARSEFVRKIEAAMVAASKPPAPTWSMTSGAGAPVPGSGSSGGVPGVRATSVDPPSRELLARMQADLQPAFDEHYAGVRLIRAGKLAEARARLEGSLLRFPNELIAIPLLDVELSQGDYISAYKLAVPFVKDGRASAELLIRASMAAAGVGEVYGGQRQFLETYLCGHSFNPTDLALLPAGSSPKTVFAISALTISDVHFIHGEMTEALPFTEAYLACDPTNPILCNSAGTEYTFVGKYLKAIEALKNGLARGTESTRFQTNLMMGLAKQRLRDYGDGNLPPSPWPTKTDSKTIKP